MTFTHEQPLNDFGWLLQVDYIVTVEGIIPSRAFHANDPDNDGTPSEVVITALTLVNKDRTRMQGLNLAMLSADDLADLREECADAYDRSRDL